jgi:hypothetical protein
MDAISEFNAWFQRPILVPPRETTVEAVLDAINQHPLAQDESAQDYVMPARRYREHAERFRIYGENQDTWYCFVRAGDELRANPAVHFESCLDLELDHDVPPHEISDESVQIAEGFRSFLRYMIASQICFRLESSVYLCHGVSGINFRERPLLGSEFVNPLCREFPGGYSVFIAPGTICAPGWGAAFRDDHFREAFIERYAPNIRKSWA